MKRMLFEELAAALLIVAMVLLVTVQVFSRYIFHVSLSHTEELVRYLFVWATFLGVAGAVHGNRHLAVSSGWSRASAPVRRFMSGLTGAGAILFALILLWYGIKTVMLQALTAQKTAALGYPMWVIGLAVPVGAALLIARILQAIRGGGER